MLIDEIQRDHDYVDLGVASQGLSLVQPHVKRAVGMARGEWKRSHGVQAKASYPNPQRQVSLPWASLDSYPDWVVNQIDNYVRADPMEKFHARRHLEQTLLEKPLLAVSTKYDGTCFGKMADGDLVGRRQYLGQ